MPVNSGLAQASNALLLTTVILYALGMLAYACDFAFGRSRALAPQVAAPELAVVAAASTSARATPTGPALQERPPRQVSDALTSAERGARGRSLDGFWLRAAFGLTCVGLAAQIVAIASRGISEHRVPWGNMYEFIAAITCMAVIVLVAASVRFRAYYLGLFVLLPVVLGLALDVTVIYTPAGALVPALQSYWIAIHVTAMIIATGLFTVGAVVTLLFLAADRVERRATAGSPPSLATGLLAHLPGSSVLDRLSYRAILFAFPVWTFGIFAGAMWADQAWGRYWGWDPKETWSFITWIVYAGFLHARATAGWRGRRAAYVQLAGYLCLMFNLVGVNLWITGLHSYAGIG